MHVDHLWGFIDESGKEGEIFSLTCVVAAQSTWLSLEAEWKEVFSETNTLLSNAKRPLLTRYHANSCSNLRGEFTGWTSEEQQAFVLRLFRSFEKHRMEVVGATLDLRDLARAIPASHVNPKGFAYAFLLKHLMADLGDRVLAKNPDSLIGLTYEQCDHNAALKESFAHAQKDLTFSYRRRFTSILEGSWKTAFPLQAADLLAYENYKESARLLIDRKRRRSLGYLLEKGQLGGILRGYPYGALEELNRGCLTLDAASKLSFLKACGVAF